MGSSDKPQDMEFGIRWKGYPPSEDSYIPLHEANQLSAMNVYAAQHHELRWLVTGDERKETRVWAGMSQKEANKLTTFLRRSKCGDTWKKHENQWLYWIQYLRQSNKMSKVGEFLEACMNDDERVVAYMLFVLWLTETPRSLRGEAVFKAIRAVKAMMVLNGFNTKWMDDERIEETRKAAKPTNEEFRISERDKPVDSLREDFLPLTLDMLERLRVESWGEGKWDLKRLDSAALVLAVFLGFDSGFRVGHLANTGVKDVNSDHRILLLDVVFVMRDGKKLNWSEALKLPVSDVWRIVFKAITSKVSNKVTKKTTEVKTLTRSSVLEGRLIEDLLEWWVKAKTKLTDPVFTRYAPKRRELIRKDMAYRIKDLVESFNLPRNRFGPKSMRIGFATGSDHLNISESQVKIRGGWSKNSNVQKKHYTKGKETGGLLAWSNASSLSVDEVKGML